MNIKRKRKGALTTTLVNRIRTWSAKRFLTRIHRVTHRMPVRLQTVERGRVLVIAPHMDDGVISSGGTLALHQQEGSTMAVVYTSDSRGDASQTGVHSETSVRTREAHRATALLDMEILDVLGYPDGKLSMHESRMTRDLAKLIQSWRPDQILYPFPSDHHRDHQATTMAVAGAVDELDFSGEMWGYEVWSTMWPNAAVDITGVVERKRDAINAYASQVENMPYAEAILGLNRYRGLRVHVPYAEAFYVSTASDLFNLCGNLIQI